MRKLVPPILFLICLILMLLLQRYLPLATLFPMPYKLLGILPIAAGLFSGAMGARHFHRAGTNIHPFRDADMLVTDGPFRYTRNPMYLGIALLLVGIWILLGGLSPVLGVLIFIVVTDRWYIAFEEQMLHRKFGADFEAYCTRTRRWL